VWWFRRLLGGGFRGPSVRMFLSFEGESDGREGDSRGFRRRTSLGSLLSSTESSGFGSVLLAYLRFGLVLDKCDVTGGSKIPMMGDSIHLIPFFPSLLSLFSCWKVTICKGKAAIEE
jgi:hypothetical protein